LVLLKGLSEIKKDWEKKRKKIVKKIKKEI